MWWQQEQQPKCDNDILQKGRKRAFPFVHHSFTIESSCCEHDIDMVCKDSFIEVAA
jgi:hypothetical protein